MSLMLINYYGRIHLYNKDTCKMLTVNNEWITPAVKGHIIQSLDLEYLRKKRPSYFIDVCLPHIVNYIVEQEIKNIA